MAKSEDSRIVATLHDWDPKLVAISVFYTGCVFRAIDSTVEYIRSPDRDPQRVEAIDLNQFEVAAVFVMFAYLGWLALHFRRCVYRYFPDAKPGCSEVDKAILEAEPRRRLYGFGHFGVSLGLFYLLAHNLGPPSPTQVMLALLLVAWDTFLVIPFWYRSNSPRGNVWLVRPWKQKNESVPYWWFKNTIELVVLTIFFLVWPFGSGWSAVVGGVLSVVLVGQMAYRQGNYFEKFEIVIMPFVLRITNALRIWIARSPLRVRIPLLFLVLLLVYQLTSRYLGLPSNAEIVDRARDFYADYGYAVAFIAALLEGLLIIGWYAPGSVVVVLGAAFAAEGVLDVRVFTGAAIAGFVVAYFIDYLIGRWGVHRLLIKFGAQQQIDGTRSRLDEMSVTRRRWLSFFSFFSPNVGGIWSTSNGTLRGNPIEFAFICVAGAVFWSCVWAGLAFRFGNQVIGVIGSPWFIGVIVLSVVAIWFFNR